MEQLPIHRRRVRQTWMMAIAVLAIPATVLAEQGEMTAAAITIDQALHFLDTQGKDVVVGPGSVMVTAGDNSMHLASQGPGSGKMVVEVAAAVGTHDSGLDAPFGYTMQGTDPDQVFLILNTLDGRLLETMGTASGVRPRGYGYCATPLRYGSVGMYDACRCSAPIGTGIIGDNNRTSYVALWRTGTGKFDFVRHQSYQAFLDRVKERWQQGLKLLDLETYRDMNENRLWAGVFGEKTGGQYLYRGLDRTTFLAKHQELLGRGYRLRDLEIYRDPIGDSCWTPPKFAGVWDQGTGRSAVELLLDHDQFHERWSINNAQGLRLVDIERDEIDSVARWSGVWEEGSGKHKLWRNSTRSSFQTKIEEARQQGLRLVDVEMYKTSSGWWWAGVFREGAGQDFMWEWEDNLESLTGGRLTTYQTYNNQGARMVDLDVKGFNVGRE